MGFNKTVKEIWKFMWESDSALSWIFDLIIAFIFIQLILFPALGILFSSSLPMVIVESGSMVHDENFDQFWQKQGYFYEPLGITKEIFSLWSFKNGFDKGDIMILHGEKEYYPGDVIVFNVKERNTPIIHRIIEKKGDIYSTKGDHNPSQFSFEIGVNQDQIIGKAVGRIPKLGWFKLSFVALFSIFSTDN